MIDLILQALILSGSLALLASSSHFTIKSIEEIIERTGLSEASAGFIILAVLTSTPEIIVAIFSILEGTPGLSIGDIIGSNIFNIGAVLGILAMLGYMKACCSDLLVELTDMLLLTSLIPLLLVVSHYHIFEISSPIIGVILLGTFLAASFLMWKRRTPPVKMENTKAAVRKSIKLPAIKLLISFVGVVVAARLVVLSATNIAVFLGVPPILIGAKIVSIGTSLPELTLDFTAVRRGRVQLAMGDIVGSNVTNLTLVLGLVLVASPFAVDMTVFAEIMPFLLITTIVFLRFLTRGGISQKAGIVLIMTYILFQAVIT
jgi:cation:H+ antiporter